MDGFYAFLLLAIVVWFILGMVRPVLSLPPVLMRYLEPGVLEPSRKIVFQWSCIFTVMVIILFCVSDLVLTPESQLAPRQEQVPASSTANDLQRRIKSTELVESRVALVNLVEEMQDAVDSGKKNCRLLAGVNYTQVQLLARDIISAEALNAKGEPGGSLIAKNVRYKTVAIHNDLVNAGCLD